MPSPRFIYGRNKHMEKYARVAFQQATQKRVLIPPSACGSCGKTAKVVGHHDDYAEPLQVKWLCKSCHGKGHYAPVPPSYRSISFIAPLLLRYRVKRLASERDVTIGSIWAEAMEQYLERQSEVEESHHESL